MTALCSSGLAGGASRRALGFRLPAASAPGVVALILVSFVALQGAQASFFGVGAPEALLVGVVALIVFGPKGLAEV